MNTTKLIPFLLVMLIISVLFIGSCSDDSKTTTDKKDTTSMTDRTRDTAGNDQAVTKETSGGTYFCTMHPLQQADNETAKCAICKMKLTSKDKHKETVDKKEDEMKAKIKDMDNMEFDEIKVARYRSDECEKYITDALKKDAAITDYYIDILEPSVMVVYDKTKTSQDKIEDAIAAAGFDPKDKEKNKSVKLPADCLEE